MIGTALACGMAVMVVGGCQGITDPAAKQVLMEKLGDTSVTVFPAFVRKGGENTYAPDAAATIAEFFKNDELADAVVRDQEVSITGPWHHNQARMLRESAEAFAAHLEQNPVETEYALFPEYLFGGRGDVGGIHCYVLNKAGVVAYAVLLNSHHKPFAEAAPKTIDDCTAVLIDVLRKSLEPAQ